MVVRPHAEAHVACTDAGVFFHRDAFRDLHIEISLYDFGLEESYGRFLKDKLYAAAAPRAGGGLVDIYV